MSVRVVERKHDLFLGPSYGAKCEGCGMWLSKYDETPEEARRGGEHEFEKHRATCPKPSPIQESLGV